MLDNSSLAKLKMLNEGFRKKIEMIMDEAIPLIKAKGYDSIIITSGYRSLDEQAKLYAKGRTTVDAVVTNAKAGHSPHNFGKAIDFVLMKNGRCQWNAPIEDWKIVGDIAKKHGCTWGGNFSTLKDYPHIEHPSWKDDRASWRKGQLQTS